MFREARAAQWGFQPALEKDGFASRRIKAAAKTEEEKSNSIMSTNDSLVIKDKLLLLVTIKQS
jgi:hypothetical protein